MRPRIRNEEYDRELLACATLICAALTVVVSLFETTKPSTAGTTAPVQRRVDQVAPVRVIGTPFVPNTDPSVRVKP